MVCLAGTTSLTPALTISLDRARCKTATVTNDVNRQVIAGAIVADQEHMGDFHFSCKHAKVPPLIGGLGGDCST